MFNLLPHHYTAVVVGASGGIGAAIINQLLSSSQVGHVIAVSRQPSRIDNPRLTHLVLDVSQEAGRLTLKKALVAQPIHPFSMPSAPFMMNRGNCCLRSALISLALKI